MILWLGLACRTPSSVRGPDTASSAPDDTGAAEPAWHVVVEGLPGGLLSISPDADGVVVVGADAGKGPAVVRQTDVGWQPLLSSPGDVWWGWHDGVSTWGVGGSGRVQRWGPFGTPTEIILAGGYTLFGVWGTGPDDVWVVGADATDGVGGQLWHIVGGEPVLALERDEMFYKVWGRGPDDVFVAGGRGLILHFDGTSWVEEKTPTDEPLFTLGGDADTTFVVGGGSNGLVLRREGAAWVREDMDVTAPGMRGISVQPGCDPVAVGNMGSVWWRRDGTWLPDLRGPALDGELHGVWLDPTCEPWVVGGQLRQMPMTGGTLITGRSDVPPFPDLGQEEVGETAPPAIFSQVTLDCADDLWRVEAITTYPAATGVDLEVRKDGASIITGALDRVEAHPQLYWIRWALSLAGPGSSENVGPIAASCGDETTWILRLRDEGGVIDCVATGAQANEVEDCAVL